MSPAAGSGRGARSGPTAGAADERFPLVEGITEAIGDAVPDLIAGLPNRLIDSVTPITAELLRWWFGPDARESRLVNFHAGQRDAIIAVIYAHEVLEVESLPDLYAKLNPGAVLEPGRTGRVYHENNQHPKYAAKMATGTGKTWVLNALLIWQYLNHRALPDDPRFSSNFLIVAPGLVVYDRLLDSFQGKQSEAAPTHAGGTQREYSTSDLKLQEELFLPPQHRDRVHAFVQNSVAAKHEIGRKAVGGGVIAITNWHLLSGAEDPDFVDEGELELDGVTAPGIDIDVQAAARSFVPLSPGVAAGNSLDALDRRYARGGSMQWLIDLPHLVVFNDEAHHIHTLKRNEELTSVQWQQSLNRIAANKGRRFAQVDFSATPYQETGTGERAKRLYFDHIVVDFDLQAAMRAGLVKSLAIDKRSQIAALGDDELEFKVERGEHGEVVSLSQGQRVMLQAGLEKLRILEEQFSVHDPAKRPKLLVMTEDTQASIKVEEYLVQQLGLPGDDVLRVDSNRKGELGPKEWEPVRRKLFGIDHHVQPRVVVSVLMLREGFDVNNICVIVPLRTAGSGILAEQTIGRGLRLMWRGDAAIEELKAETRERLRRHQAPENYLDVLFVVEHPRFVNLYDELLGEGYAAELTEEITQSSVAGDLETLDLKPGWQAYDFAVPFIVRDGSEELAEPAIDVTALAPSKYPAADLIRQIGSGDRWSSRAVETGTMFGDYRVDGGVMTATGYRDWLARMTNRITEALGRTFIGAEGHGKAQYTKAAQYPVLLSYKPLLVGWIDQYIRTRAFGPSFDPFEAEAWRVLLVGDVSQEIAGVFAAALVAALESEPTSEAEVVLRRVSEVSQQRVRASSAVEVQKAIFAKLPVAARGGGTERLFLEWADADAGIEAITKIDEFAHWFLHRAYLKADGSPSYYSPDFLVRTGETIFVVETKGQQMLTEANVRRKQKAALSWVERLNALPAAQREGRIWRYVLLGSATVDEWRRKGASVSSLLEYAAIRPEQALPAELF